MAVFLINPSDHSFGTAVITPRWLYVLAGATPLSFGDPVIVDETLEAAGALEHPAGRLCRHRHSHRQRLARLRGRQPGARAWRMGCLWRYSRHLYTRRSAGARPRALRGQGRWRCRLVQSAAGLRPGQSRTGFTRAARSMRISSLPPAGTCCRRTNTCGHRCRRFVDALSIALSALSGVPTVNVRDSGHLRASLKKSSSCGGRASAILPWRTIISIP